MKCFECASENTITTDSRPANRFGGCTRRRVKCLECDHRSTTFEVHEDVVECFGESKKDILAEKMMTVLTGYFQGRGA